MINKYDIIAEIYEVVGYFEKTIDAHIKSFRNTTEPLSEIN